MNKLPLNNYALILAAVIPSNPPSAPPNMDGTNTQCFSSTASSDKISGDPVSGRQLANLSCNQMADRTIEYWFNDMGGGNIAKTNTGAGNIAQGDEEDGKIIQANTSLPVDPRDYNNLEFSIRCTGTTTTPGSVNGAASSTISLLHQW